MRVVITGGSAGLGLALSRQAAGAGHEVVVIGRRALDEVPPDVNQDRMRYVRADLGSQAGRQAAIVALAGWPAIDRLVHNAAVGRVADIAAHSIDDVTQQIAVNLTAPVVLTHALIKQLIAGRGQVMFVGSTAVRRAQPKFPVYTATKAAIDGLARNLKTEMRGRLTVATHHPGPLRTGFHRRAGMKQTALWHLFTPPEREARALARKTGLDVPA